MNSSVASVMEGDVGDLGRQGEGDMEVADRQQIGFPLGKPGPRRRALASGTVPVPVAAAVLGDAPLTAVLAGPPRAAVRQFSIADITLR